MTLNYQKDPASQVPPLPSGNEGVDSVVRFYQDGTDEVKNLLKKECNLIYECSFCRSLFRSIINFMSHKRTICRSLQSSIRSEQQLEVSRQINEMQQFQNGQNGDELLTEPGGDGNIAAANKTYKRLPHSLRRFNPASNLSKHIRSVQVKLGGTNTIDIPTLPRTSRPLALTSIKNGQQIIDQLPLDLAIKEQLPNDRTALVMPQENSARCGDMQLRPRRVGAGGLGGLLSGIGLGNENVNAARNVSSNEIEIIERVPSNMPGDFQTLRCLDERCMRKGIQPFFSIAILAHHLAVYHQLENVSSSETTKRGGVLSTQRPFKCFLCKSVPFKTLSALKNHFNAQHADVRALHVQSRFESAADFAAIGSSTALTKYRRGGKDSPRFRSISPPSSTASSDDREIAEKDNDEDEQEDDEAEENDETSAISQPHKEALLALRDWRNKTRRVGPTTQKTSLSNTKKVPPPPKRSPIKSSNTMSSSDTCVPSSSKDSTEPPPQPSIDEALKIDALLNSSQVLVEDLNSRESKSPSTDGDDSPVANTNNTSSAEREIPSRAGRKTKNIRRKIMQTDEYGQDPNELEETTASMHLRRFGTGDYLDDFNSRSIRDRKKTKRFFGDEFVDPERTVEGLRRKNVVTPSLSANTDAGNDKIPKSVSPRKKRTLSPGPSSTVKAEDEDKPTLQQLPTKRRYVRKTGEDEGVKKIKRKYIKKRKAFDSLWKLPYEGENTKEKTSQPEEPVIAMLSDVSHLERLPASDFDGVLHGNNDDTTNSTKALAEMETTSIDDAKAVGNVVGALVHTVAQTSSSNNKPEEDKQQQTSRFHALLDAATNAIEQEKAGQPVKSGSEPPKISDDSEKRQKHVPKSSKHGSKTDEEPVGFLLPKTSDSAEVSAQTPTREKTPPPQQTPTKDSLPSLVTERNRENLAFYTPKARKARILEEEHRGVNNNESLTAAGSSRRKQNLNAIRETEGSSGGGITVLGASGSTKKTAAPPPRPEDLTEVPVYLTEIQRDLFFAPLRPLFNKETQSDGLHQCGECGEVLKCIRDGRRHMVSHLRVMRIRCSLCDAGAFFCSDMRIHLMFRHCEKLHLAPDDFVLTGNAVPCMDKKKADMLTQLVDPYHPGRVMYTSGKIVSWSNPKAYCPDLKIEERILGKAPPLNQPQPPTILQHPSTISTSPNPNRLIPSATTAITASSIVTQEHQYHRQEPVEQI